MLPITDRPIRFALVGCGRISANHIDALRQHAQRAEPRVSAVDA
jgi:UDP-N-acetyl-2-amino-2-deoxyglucuronate dehydrogenase